MLDLINNLKPFFEDCYTEMGVREYSRKIKVSPPTASKILKKFESEGFLSKRVERGYLLFKINRNCLTLKILSKIYWFEKFKKLIEYLNSELYHPTIVLFGSLAKLEATNKSDIDLALFSNMNKEINIQKYEKLYHRKIQIFRFDSLKNVNKELADNILNGEILSGRLEL